MLSKERMADVDGNVGSDNSSDNDEPMLSEDAIKRNKCISFIDEELRPEFDGLIVQMMKMERFPLVEQLYELLLKYEQDIKQKVESVYGKECCEEVRGELLVEAGQVIFSAEVIPDVIFVLGRILKLSFVLFNDIENANNKDVHCKRKTEVLDHIASTVQIITEKDHFSVKSHVCRDAMRIACGGIVRNIVQRVTQEHASSYNSLLPLLTQRVSDLSNWASRVHLVDELNALEKHIKATMEKSLVNSLTKQIFDLAIVDYPESGELVDDLRVCMQNNDGYGRTKLTEILAKDVKRRLLHIGVGTRDILQGYASAVDCLRRVDPTCVIMHNTCSIIRAYIKQRPDTVRSIITYITGEKREELSQQLAKKRAAIIDEEDISGINDELIAADDENDQKWEEWLPDPPDAIPSQSRRFRQNADVFNMLVSVYGSKELFVKEYRQLLAERLTKSWNRDPLFELRYLELLKLRFSEGELQQCEVMLKDMRDSENDDINVNSSLPFPISARIMSSFFWPKIENEQFNLPDEMMHALSVYGKGFAVHKAFRRLEWMTGVGCVEMDIELDGVTVSLAVSPAHTALIALFMNKETWTVNEIASTLGMDKRNVKKRLEWWQNSGIVAVSVKTNDGDGETWCLASASSKMSRIRGDVDMDDESSEEESGEDTAAVDALEQYWTYTRSYMANREPMKPERLHGIFRLFASPGQHGPSLETVISFLQRKVKLNLLSCSAGLYRIVKDSDIAQNATQE